MIQNQLIFSNYPDQKDGGKVVSREKRRAGEKLPFEGHFTEGRADGYHKRRSWDKSQKEPGANMDAEVARKRQV